MYIYIFIKSIKGIEKELENFITLEECMYRSISNKEHNLFLINTRSFVLFKSFRSIYY